MMGPVALKCTALVTLVFLTLTVTSCGSGQAGPLQALSERGQPIVNGASVQVPPGYPADFTAFLFNPLSSLIRLLSATIVPVTGHFPAARLLHVGIGTSPGIAGASSGWPLRYVPTRPLAGGLIRHGQSNIIFAVTGPVSGRNYYVAGLKIGYCVQGPYLLCRGLVRWRGLRDHQIPGPPFRCVPRGRGTDADDSGTHGQPLDIAARGH